MKRKRSFALVDTHCHIDLYPDPVELANEVEAAKVYTIALTNAPSVFPMTEDLLKGKKFLRPALGLHPELVQKRVGELPLFESYLPRTRYIGEVGLDYVTLDPSNRKVQRKVFERILELCNAAGDKILTVHSRRAASDVVAAIPDNFNGQIILHWYSGSIKVLKQAIAKGCYLSVNFAMVKATSGRKLLHEIPLARLLTESDGPFVKVGETAMKPTQMNLVIDKMAAELSLEVSDIQQSIHDNFHHLLKSEK